MDKYKYIEFVDSWRYTRVYRALNSESETGEHVIVKEIGFQDVTGGVPCSIIRQVSILKELDHPNVIRLLEVVPTKEQINLVFENSEFDLKTFMKNVPLKQNPVVIKNLLRQILCAVAYFHSYKILHRDLKPETILIDRYVRVKVAGFGLSREIGVPRNAYTAAEVLTLHYLAPEILLGDLQYSYPVDIWAVGCIFAEMAAGRKIFHTPINMQLDQINKIFSILGTPDEKTWPGCTKLNPKPEDIGIYYPQDLAKEVRRLDQNGLDLLSKMLCMGPSKRITALDALKHPYFANNP